MRCSFLWCNVQIRKREIDWRLKMYVANVVEANAIPSILNDSLVEDLKEDRGVYVAPQLDNELMFASFRDVLDVKFHLLRACHNQNVLAVK